MTDIIDEVKKYHWNGDEHEAATAAILAKQADELGLPAELLEDGVGLTRRTAEPAIERARQRVRDWEDDMWSAARAMQPKLWRPR